jgi:hypothetical protein
MNTRLASVAVPVLLAALAVGACSSAGASRGSENGARRTYQDWADKYVSVAQEADQAMGAVDAGRVSSFEQEVLTQCARTAADEARNTDEGWVIMQFGPTLAKHGRSVPEFTGDARRLREAILDAGLCDQGAPALSGTPSR